MALTKTQKLGVIGGCMFLFSILMSTFILSAVVKSQTRKKVALKEGWQMRTIWSKFPFIIEFNFYIFNVTNPEGIKNGEKPKLQQIGPFVYDEYHEKTNQVDRDEDDTVVFTTKNTFHFNAEKSNGLTSEEEVIVPNYFALGLFNTVKREKPSAMPIVGKAIDSIFKKPDSMFVKAKVRDIFFDGMPVDCTVTDFAGSAVCNELRDKYTEFGMAMVAENQYLLSLWGSRNGSDSKNKIRVYRGLKNLMDVGQVIEMNSKPNISIWDDEYCDSFNGTDGTVFHPFFDKKGKEDLVAFNEGLCRGISCYFDSKSKFAGMKTLRYTADLGTDPEKNPHHKCYCEAPDKCLRPGAYDAFKCIGLPLVVTNPHFYMADPYYLEMVEGLQPEREKHMIMIDLDPFTGSPMHARTKAQFNMFVFKYEKYKIMKNFPEALLPLFWIDEIIILPDFLIKEIKMGHTMYKMGLVFQYLMMFGGIGMAGFAGFRHYQETQGENKLDKKKTVVTKANNGNNNNANGDKKMNISTLQVPAPVPPNVD